MSNMTDYDAGKLVASVELLNERIKDMNNNTEILSMRLCNIEKQMAKGKGMFAGAMMLAMGLGGLGGQIFGKWFN
jgi:hypothetical protein|tara:strand:- start:265 stop:489 length:225 start_codon:yes stop_codon:yes gene_type:complete